MTKKATKRKAVELNAIELNAPHVAMPATPAVSAVAAPSEFAQGVVAAASQVYSSEAQALDFLLGSITDKLCEKGDETSQMHEFLSLLIDTDPGLREEILAGITIRK